METILYTKTNDLVIRTCYNADSAEFVTIVEYPNGEQVIAETFKSVMFMLEIHDSWCKFTGVIEDKVTSEEVNAHLIPA